MQIRRRRHVHRDTSSQCFKEKAEYDAAKAYINQAKKKKRIYSSLKQVIFLGFTNYPFFLEKANYKSHHQIQDIGTHEQKVYFE
ncbi:MAG: hypothetical protein AAF380_01245 [Bacteroidota bacterium]